MGASLGSLWTQFPVKVFAESPPNRWQRPLQYALDTWSGVLPLRWVSARQGADIVISWAHLPGGNMGTERSSLLVREEGDNVVKVPKTISIILDNSYRLSEPQMCFYRRPHSRLAAVQGNPLFRLRSSVSTFREVSTLKCVFARIAFRLLPLSPCSGTNRFRCRSLRPVLHLPHTASDLSSNCYEPWRATSKSAPCSSASTAEVFETCRATARAKPETSSVKISASLRTTPTHCISRSRHADSAARRGSRACWATLPERPYSQTT
jgi:hypothetical protein